LFDGSPAAQQILYLAKTQLLDEHAYVVHDPAEVKRHLDSIVYNVKTLLNGKPYYCLIEMQYFDQEASRGLVFPLQLESCIGMYFVQKGVPIRTIQATKRYPFLDIKGWKQDTRWRRKQRVVEVVSNILNPAMPGNAFAQGDHDLSTWHQYTPAQRHDIADAIAQCLAFHYRALQFVYACRPAAVVNAANYTPTTSQQPTQPPRSQPSSSSRRDRQQPPSLAELRGRMERTLAQLGIDHYQLLIGEPSNSARLFRVHQRDPNNRHLKAFLKVLNNYNHQGTDVPNLETLEARLTPLQLT
jgi:hypothetical protein